MVIKINHLCGRQLKSIGWENIKHEILYTNLTKELAEQKEIELILKYKTTDSKYGYNVSNGGNCLGTLTEKTKEKIRNANIGKKLKEETKKKISNTLAGRQHTEEEKRKIGYSLKVNGKHCKEVINLDTGEIYKSLKEASKEFNVKNPTHIIEVCKGKRHTAYGYKWAYVKGVV